MTSRPIERGTQSEPVEVVRFRAELDRLELLERRLLVTNQGVRVVSPDTPRIRLRSHG